MGDNYRAGYDVDIVMVMDATGSMGGLLDIVKKNAMNFYDDLMKVMNSKGKHISELRVRVIAFRDYAEYQNEIRDGKKLNEPMLLSQFFSLPTQSEEFKRIVSGIKAEGGGDRPEDGLEALAYAIKSEWNLSSQKHRHVIVVWSDDATHELGFGRSADCYPKKMPNDFDELTEWWGDKQNPGLMDYRSKRLLIFAPDKKYWSTISDSWDNVIHFPSEAGKGLQDVDYETILNAIANTI